MVEHRVHSKPQFRFGGQTGSQLTSRAV
jgi:hypothetical protein